MLIKKVTCSFIAVLLMSLTANATEQIQSNKQKDGSLIYHALFFINKNIQTTYIKQYPDVNYCSLEQNITDFMQYHPNLLKKVTSQELTLADKWVELDQKIKSITPMESDADINFTDVIFYIPKAHFLYLPYFTRSEYIDNYHSIGENNICKLYDDLLSYLITLNDQDLTAFFDEYRDVYRHLSNKLNK